MDTIFYSWTLAIVTLKHNLHLNASPIGFINPVINKPKINVLIKKEVQPLSFMSVLYVRGVSEKFRRLANRYNIKTVFKTRNTVRNSLMRTRPISSPQKTVDCIYSIPCECGRSYTGETGILWPAGLGEHKENMEVGHLE